MSGALCGGIGLSDDGRTGWAVGEADWTGPGGGGWGLFAVVLAVPGSTTVSESWMLGLVLGSGGLKSA